MRDPPGACCLRCPGKRFPFIYSQASALRTAAGVTFSGVRHKLARRWLPNDLRWRAFGTRSVETNVLALAQRAAECALRGLRWRAKNPRCLRWPGGAKNPICLARCKSLADDSGVE